MTARPERVLFPPQAKPEIEPFPSQDIGDARERFFSAEPVQPTEVRQTIIASWQRSSEYHVDCDALSTPYENDLDVQGRLAQASTPVLDRMRDQVADQPVSIVLTNAEGFVLARRTGRRDLESHLDGVCLAPGFSYAEQFVGTNGIGTALEVGKATFVYEQEHFTGPLIDLACAGVPIHDPITGTLQGILDVTCFAEDSNQLLMAMAASAAQGIEARLLSQTHGRDVTLLQEYLRASRRSTDPILAVNDRVLMLNDKAHATLSAPDQALIVEHVRSHGATRRSGPTEVDLPSGSRCRIHTNPVSHGADAGAVARIQLTPVVQLASEFTITSPPALPGVVGSGAMWRQCCRMVDRHYRQNSWVLLEGEAGVGKAALAQAVHRYHNPTHPVRIFGPDDQASLVEWCSQQQQDASESHGTVIFRHPEDLDPATLRAVENVLESAADSGRLWAAATVDANAKSSAALDRALGYFSRTVEVPPLRHHVEDIEEIAPLMLQQATKRRDVSIAPAAMRALLRSTWPGNIAELQRVIQTVASRIRHGTVSLEDLPPQCSSRNRRVLSPIESIERDAIVQSLTEASGNRVQAARALGISRATIYRKMKDYGIDMPANDIHRA